MPEQRENSVLFSLKELRKIEDDRVQREKDEVRARAEAERRAREEAEQRAREEAERKVREEQDRVARAEAERQRAIREEQLRLEEAERKARLDAEMRLQEERMRLEVAAKKHAKSPVGAIVGVAVVFLAIGGIIFYKVNKDNEAERMAREQRIAEIQREAERRALEAEKKYQAQMTALQEQLSKATSDADRARVRAQMDAANAERERSRARTSTRRPSETGSSKPEAPVRPKLQERRQIDDDPLGGLK